MQAGVEVIHEDRHAATQSVQHGPDQADPRQRAFGFLFRIDGCGPLTSHVVQTYEVADDQSVSLPLGRVLFKSVQDPERPLDALGKLGIEVAVESLEIGDAEVGGSDQCEDLFTCLGGSCEVGGPSDALRTIAGIHQQQTGSEPGEQRPERGDDSEPIIGFGVCRRASDREQEGVPSGQA